MVSWDCMGATCTKPALHACVDECDQNDSTCKHKSVHEKAYLSTAATGTADLRLKRSLT